VLLILDDADVIRREHALALDRLSSGKANATLASCARTNIDLLASVFTSSTSHTGQVYGNCGGVVTRNVDDFEPFGVPLINPFAGTAGADAGV
jgi:hypothetical protein